MPRRPESPHPKSTTGGLHLLKLAVGVPSVEAFFDRVAQRRQAGAGMQVWTRSRPRRADEILGGGSLFWVVAGVLSVRQRILAIEDDRYDDGTACTRIEVEPTLVRIAPRAVRPFQGWRYLSGAAVPGDITRAEADGLGRLPAAVLRDLRELCLV